MKLHNQKAEVATTQTTSSHAALQREQVLGGTTTHRKPATPATNLSNHSSRQCSSMVHKSHAQRPMAPAAALLLSLHLRRHCRAFPKQALQIRCPRLQQVHGLEQIVSHREMDLAESENHIHADSGSGRAQGPRNLNAEHQNVIRAERSKTLAWLGPTDKGNPECASHS